MSQAEQDARLAAYHRWAKRVLVARDREVEALVIAAFMAGWRAAMKFDDAEGGPG